MKTILLVGLLLMTSLWPLSAAERASLEDAQKGVLLLNNALGEVSDGPFRLELDAFKPCAIKGDGGAAALVVPTYSLGMRIKKARRGLVVPVGQLWLHKVLPVVAGKPVAREALRLVQVNGGDGVGQAAMFHLGFEKLGDGGRLLVYGRGKEPLLRIVLSPMEVPQETPIEIEAKKGESGRPELVLYLADRFEARIPLAQSE